MRYIFLILLLIAFAYSMVVVWLNPQKVVVDLFFNNTQELGLGFLLFLTVVLGIVIGLLLGLQLFRVFQNQWEIRRLRKEIETLKKAQMDEVATKALHYARDHMSATNENVAHMNQQPVVNQTVQSENKAP